MQEFLKLLRHPEYIHVLLNPMPVYALSMGLLALALAMFLRNRQAEIIALLLILLCTALAWPIWLYGHKAHEHLEPSLNKEAKAWLQHHMDLGDKGSYLLRATAVLAILSLVTPRKIPKWTRTFILATIIT
jgi:dolichol kinase